MLIIGLTGSMGMGKSAAAERFRERGIGVFDADAEVHRLYAGPLSETIEQAFPGTTRDGVVDRQRLSRAVLGNEAKIKTLEKLVHGRVRENERSFLHGEAASGARMSVLEIPLLFETGADALVDVVIVVSAPQEMQRARVLARVGMTEEKLELLLSRQMTDAEKRKRAHFIVDTSGPLESCHAQIDKIISQLESRAGTAYARHWA